MNTKNNIAVNVATTPMLFGFAGYSEMSTQDKNPEVVADIGAIGGTILVGGSAAGMAGGATAGGDIGHEVNK